MAESPGEDRIAVTVLGGYLGAGKTTLLNHLLTTADERFAVLVNDFGSINVDESLIADRSGDTIALTNGCICCSLVDGFSGALEQVRSLDPRPTRLVIEASGVADPAAVAAWGHGPGLRLDGVVSVVDAERVRRSLDDEYVGDVVRQQIAAADLLVLNKLDLVEDALRKAIERRLGEISHAPVIGAVNAEVPAAVLLGSLDPVGERTGSSPPANDTHLAWSHTFVHPPSEEELRTWMDALPATTVRAKGVLGPEPGATGSRIVHKVGSRWSVEAHAERPHDGVSVIVGIDVGPPLPSFSSARNSEEETTS